ncbi:MAG: metallophosphoesterase [Muribaculaceae bacterium]|nr:metallophosphoesterase [Muribaculaceae bacterium]
MEKLSHNESATSFVSKFNTNAGNDVLDVDESATQAVADVNATFNGVAGTVGVSIDDNAEDFADAINDNFRAMDDSGGTTTSVRFLHISDNHDSIDAIEECGDMMDEDDSISFTILTGDYSHQTAGISTELRSSLENFGHEFLILTGNHDIKNSFANNQANATAFIKSIIHSDDVVFGDSNNVASYYYKDIALSFSSKLRIIVMDSYDYRAGGTPANYDTFYTDSQMRWFVNLLKGLSGNDYFIVAMHEPPINSTSTSVSMSSPEPGAAAKRRENKFCSANLYEWDSSLSNGIICPIIIDAYQNSQHLKTRVNNVNSSSGVAVSDVAIDADFTQGSKATFLFYLGGHLHGDMCAYHPSYPNQLILLVDDANPSPLGSDSDITSRTNGTLINDVTVDFENRQTVITRVGQKSAVAANGFPALTRDTITFPFARETNND